MPFAPDSFDINSHNPTYFCSLGNVFSALGRFDDAISCYNKALELKPGFTRAYYNMGNALQDRGDFHEAISCYQKALTLRPDFAEAYYNMGCAFRDCGDSDDAIFCYQKALESRPDLVKAYHCMGNVFQDIGRLNKAISAYRKAVDLLPTYAEAYNNLGEALKQDGDLEEAIFCFQKAIQLKPGLVEAYYNLGHIFQDRGDLEQAISSLQKALTLKPDLSEAHLTMGDLFKGQGKLAEAVSCYQKAIEASPGYAEAYNNMGLVLKEQLKLNKALSAYDKALQINPRYAQAHFNRSLVLLHLGRFGEAWKGYEWRFKRPGWKNSYFHCTDKPLWDGSSFAGKKLFIHSEQGFGDTFQFIRYLPMVKALGGTVLLETIQPLFGLVENFSGVDQLVERSPHTPTAVEHDLYVYLMSLPGIFGTTLDTIPVEVPYLYADAEKAEHWRGRLSGEGFRVGIVWGGKATDPNRSCELKSFAPLAAIPDVRLYGLQKGEAANQVESLPERMAITNLGEELKDFSDTAGVIENLDLIISVDTSVAHLAGSMGKPVWVLLRFSADWRWLLEREDSPWYPTMRLFRQKKPGDWDYVLQRVAKQLTLLVKNWLRLKTQNKRPAETLRHSKAEPFQSR